MMNNQEAAQIAENGLNLMATGNTGYQTAGSGEYSDIFNPQTMQAGQMAENTAGGNIPIQEGAASTSTAETGGEDPNCRCENQCASAGSGEPDESSCQCSGENQQWRSWQPDKLQNSGDILRRVCLLSYINDTLGIPLGNGRLMGKPLNVFIDKATLAAGRAVLEFFYLPGEKNRGQDFASLSNFADELGAMSPGRKYGREAVYGGFAKFMNLYITAPKQAMEKAPRFHNYFEDALKKKCPETKETFFDARGYYYKWLKQPELQRVVSHLAVDEDAGTRGNNYDDFFVSAMNDILSLRQSGEDAEDYVRFMKRYTPKAAVFIESGAFNFNTKEYESESLRSIISGFDGSLDEFRAYIVCRKTLEGFDNSISKTDAEKIVSDYDNRFGQSFEELKKFQDCAVQYMKDAGMLNSGTYAEIKKLNDDYAPLYKLMNGEEFMTESIGGDIPDPLETVLKNTYMFINTAEKNAAAHALVEMAGRVKGMDKYIKKVSAAKL